MNRRSTRFIITAAAAAAAGLGLFACGTSADTTPAAGAADEDVAAEATDEDAAAEATDDDAATDTESADDADIEQVTDPDTYAGAVDYVDLAEEFGPIPAPADGTQLGFVAKAFENEFWGAVKDGVEDQASVLEEAGMDLTVDVRAAQGEGDEQGQASLMTDMVNRQYDAIIASPISDGNLVQATEVAHNEGIPVVNTIGGFQSSMDVFVGPRHYHSGELAAQWIETALDGAGGEVAVIMGMPRESAARGRTDGFSDYFANQNSGFEVVATQNADWDRGKARDVMQSLLQQYPDLVAVYANNDTMAMGALEGVRAAGKLGEVLVVGNDGTNEALQSIGAGELDATVNIYPNFAGRISVDIALRTIAGQELPRVIYTNQAVIDSTNVDVAAETIIGWPELLFE
jgi:ribose transport system substrate-binding protein